jgi:thymidine kinase
MAEAELEQFGVAADASLVLVTKKLVCSKCGSKAVRAYRYIDDELQPVFKGPPVAPKE